MYALYSRSQRGHLFHFCRLVSVILPDTPAQKRKPNEEQMDKMEEKRKMINDEADEKEEMTKMIKNMEKKLYV